MQNLPAPKINDTCSLNKENLSSSYTMDNKLLYCEGEDIEGHDGEKVWTTSLKLC